MNVLAKNSQLAFLNGVKLKKKKLPSMEDFETYSIVTVNGCIPT